MNIPLTTNMENFVTEYTSIELEAPNEEKYHLGAMLAIQDDADGKGNDGVAIYFSQLTLAFMMTKEEALAMGQDLIKWANGNTISRLENN